MDIVTDGLKLQAYAKINLSLDVLRQREDGYHEVRMVMQTIQLHDRIDLFPKKEPGIDIHTNLSFLPVNENNLMFRAAKLLIDEFSLEGGVRMRLQKIIPVSAGMAGGSSDAAAVLDGMNRLFSLGLSREELRKRGLRLGADVPFCFMRGAALSEGIGERLSPLPGMPPCWIVIAKPAFSISTRFVYENLHVGRLPRSAHPDVDAVISALNAGEIPALSKNMGNILETVSCREHPEIRAIKERMLSLGALGTLMSGSGPSVFGLFSEKSAAERCRRDFRFGEGRRLAGQAFLTEPWFPKAAKGRKGRMAKYSRRLYE